MNGQENQTTPQAPQQASEPVAPPPQQHVSAPSVHSTEPVQTTPQAPEKKRLAVKFEDDLVLYVTPDIVDNMRFLELYDLVSENNLKLPKLLRFMFGDEAYESIYTYYESRGLTFSMTKMEAVFEKFNTDMNSNPDFLRQ